MTISARQEANEKHISFRSLLEDFEWSKKWSWLQKEKGFFLVEVAIAIFLLLLLLAVMLPTWVTLQEKLKQDRQQALALMIAQNELEYFYQHTALEERLELGADALVTMNGERFYIEWQVQDILLDEEGQMIALANVEQENWWEYVYVQEGSLRVWWPTGKGGEQELFFQALRGMPDIP